MKTLKKHFAVFQIFVILIVNFIEIYKFVKNVPLDRFFGIKIYFDTKKKVLGYTYVKIIGNLCHFTKEMSLLGILARNRTMTFILKNNWIRPDKKVCATKKCLCNKKSLFHKKRFDKHLATAEIVLLCPL